MVTFGIRLIRAACLAGLLALGLLAAPIGGTAVARPFSGEPTSDPGGTGDPTGDDLPSPTPKPAGPAVRPQSQSGTTTQVHARPRALSLYERLSLYLRVVARFSIR